MTRTGFVVVLLLALPAAGCGHYRQSALGITPAATAECPDMSRGCSRTVVGLLWNAVRVKDPPLAACGPTGLAEVTVRNTFLGTLVGVVTLGLVAPHQVEWKCAPPHPASGGGIVTDSTPPRR